MSYYGAHNVKMNPQSDCTTPTKKQIKALYQAQRRANPVKRLFQWKRVLGVIRLVEYNRDTSKKGGNALRATDYRLVKYNRFLGLLIRFLGLLLKGPLMSSFYSTLS
jgi:hypothetical protein